MNVEIRPCRDREELADYGKIVSYVFASNEGMDEELESTQPEWTTCGFVDGKMVATMGTFPFTVRFNGVPVHMGGVTAVGTLPQHRRKGLLRRIMTQGLATMRDRGQNIAILWASMGAIYQRFGYGLASTEVMYRFDPRDARFQEELPVPGSVELTNPEAAMPVIKPLYIEYATPRNLLIHRAMPLWQASTLRPEKKGEPVYVAIYRNAEGTPRGYVVYQTREDSSLRPGPDQLLEVKDYIALDIEAYRGLWEFLWRHDLVGRIVIRGALPEDDPAPDLLLEPRALQRSTYDGIWMRIVDVEKALASRPYGQRGDLRIAFEGDEMCPWNNGTYVLATDGPTADVARKDRVPDLTVNPNALASLLSGHRSATQLARAGRLTARDEQSLRLADAMFATEYRPHTPNGF
ncbi:MAG: enhanced intracellular survival protein Eis [Hyphomicrobiales bacterium]